MWRWQRWLSQHPVKHVEIDIDLDEEAYTKVRAWTGHECVPTLVIAPDDGLDPIEPPEPLPGRSPRAIDRGSMLSEPNPARSRPSSSVGVSRTARPPTATRSPRAATTRGGRCSSRRSKSRLAFPRQPNVHQASSPRAARRRPISQARTPPASMASAAAAKTSWKVETCASVTSASNSGEPNSIAPARA